MYMKNMRKTLFSSLLLLAVLLLSVACNEENKIELPIDVIDGSGLTITGIIEDSHSDGDTKVGIIDNVTNFGTAGEKFYWVNGDQIKILLYPGGDINATPIVGTFAAVVGTGLRSNDCNFAPVGAPITIPKGTYTVYALYPANAWVQNPNKSWTVSMPSGNIFAQNTASAESVGAYMFKKADAGTVVIANGNNMIRLPFRVMSSLLRYSIRRQPYESRATAFSKVTLTATSQIFPTTGILSDISATSLTAGATKTNSLTVNVVTSWQDMNGNVDVFVPILPTGNLSSSVNFNIALTGTGFRYPLEYPVTSVTTKIPSLASGFRAPYSYYFNIKHNTWARSNIVHNGNKLTFAITHADNATIPSNVQGVFFQWGSLVAIAPSNLATGTNRDYIAADYPAGHILFSPAPLTTSQRTWAGMPHVNETTAPFDNANGLYTEDDFLTYNGGTGFYTTVKKGDICRYISSRGWVTGKWRLPTMQEIHDVMQASSVFNNQAGLTDFAPNGSNSYGSYHLGFYLVQNGRLVGPNRSVVGRDEPNYRGNPSTGTYFPFSGQRDRVEGGLTGINPAGAWGMEMYADYWTASSAVSTSLINAFHLRASSTSMGSSSSANSRSAGHPVRCIRD